MSNGAEPRRGSAAASPGEPPGPAARLRPSSGRVLRRRAGEDALEEDKKSKIEYSFKYLGDLTTLVAEEDDMLEDGFPTLQQLRVAMACALEEQGAVKSMGPGPKGELVRAVERDFKKLKGD